MSQETMHTETIGQNATPTDNVVARPWPVKYALVWLMAGVVTQSVVLPCLCYEGTVKMQIAGLVDLLVLLRIVVAGVRKETGRGWIFYAALPLAMIPIIELIVVLWK